MWVGVLALPPHPASNQAPFHVEQQQLQNGQKGRNYEEVSVVGRYHCKPVPIKVSEDGESIEVDEGGPLQVSGTLEAKDVAI